MPEYYAFERHPGIDLRGVDLVEAVLLEAELPGANLEGVKAYDAFANGVVLTGATVSGANFVKAQLIEADFSDAVAHGTKFNRADLQDARFDRASLRGASFFDSYLGGASFVGADVTDADFTHALLAGAALSAQPVTDELDCKLLVDGVGDRAALTELVRVRLRLTAEGDRLSGHGMALVVDNDDDAQSADETGVQWYFAPDVGLPLRVALVGDLMNVLRHAGGRVVAACGYEDALP